MTAMAQALSAALLHFVWQGSLVAVVLWAALLTMRKRPAAWRYGASSAALALLAALPAVTVWMLARPLAAAPAGAATFFFAAAPGASLTRVSWLTRVESWALPVWSLGVLLLSIRLVWGAGQLYGLRRRGQAATGAVVATVEQLAARMGVRQPVAVWISAMADGPSVVGWIRPLILLPSATLMGLTPEQLEAVLAHELAHIRRFDYAVNLLQMLVETLLFYHPAVWWVSARMRHERELCCDDLAVESCGNALCYARALTRLERLRLTAPGMAMASTGGPLLYRIQRLMGVAGAEYRPSRLPAILAVCLGLGCLALNVHWAKAQEQAQEKPRQQEPASVTVTTRDGQAATITLRNGVKAEPPSNPNEFYMAADQGRTATYTFRQREEPRVDRGVQIDTGGAAIVKREPVEYPGSAIERNIQGVVTVEAIQDANGDVTDAHVLAGPQELRKAALHSVLEWRFQPAAAGTARQVNLTFQIPPGGFPKEPEEQRLVILRDRAKAVAESVEQNRQTMAFLEQELDQSKKQYEATPEGMPRQEMAARMAELQRKLQAARQVESVGFGIRAQEEGPGAVVGRTVKSIDARGMSESQSAELILRLGVHLGDTMTADSLKRLEEGVRQYDERLIVGYALEEGGQVGIRIVPTEGGERVRVRK